MAAGWEVYTCCGMGNIHMFRDEKLARATGWDIYPFYERIWFV